jgi:formylglycine-generating enzyme required for sulfatase activity
MGSSWASPADESDPRQREAFGTEVASNTVGFRVVREID